MSKPKIDNRILTVWIVLMVLDLLVFGVIAGVAWHFIQKLW